MTCSAHFALIVALAIALVLVVAFWLCAPARKRADRFFPYDFCRRPSVRENMQAPPFYDV